MQNTSTLHKSIVKLFKIQQNSKNNIDTMAIAANKIKKLYYLKKIFGVSDKIKAAKKIQKMFKKWKKAYKDQED